MSAPERHAGALRPLSDGTFAARIHVAPGDGGRKQFPLEACGTSREAAATRCRELATLACRLQSADEPTDSIERIMTMGARSRGQSWRAVVTAVDAICAGKHPRAESDPIPTFATFAKRWTSGKLHETFPDHVAKKDHRTDITWCEKYIFDDLADVPIDMIALEHCEKVMASLPSTLAPATRRHVAQVMRRVLALSVYPAKLRKDNPIPRGWLPRLKSTKAKECLYPEEDAKLLAHVKTPILRRLTYGFLAREGMRRGELDALRWGDIDLDRGRVKLDENKTDDPRAWALDAGVHKALIAWHRWCGKPDATTHVFAELGVPLNTDRLAEHLRRDLEGAGVDRDGLLKGSKTRLALRAHDLRATFVTVSLANGKSETWVADRTGHRSSTMINRYRRNARTWGELGLGELTPLHLAIPELRALAVGGLDSGSGSSPATGDTSSALGTALGNIARVAKLADAVDLGSQHEPPRNVPIRETRDVDDPRSNEIERQGLTKGRVEGRDLLSTMRAKLDAAIVAEQWDAVKVIGARVRELEREGVPDLADVRARRTPR